MKFCDERIQKHLLNGGKIKRKLGSCNIIACIGEKGYMAMDQDCGYFYYNTKPKFDIKKEEWNYDNICSGLSYIFNIEPVEDWTKSLIEVGK